MNFRFLKTFISISENKSFTKTAESGGMTQAAVSQQIKDLEENLGQKLINRSTRPIRLTQTGQAFAQTAKQILHLKERFQSTFTKSGEWQTIKAGVITSLLTTTFPVILKKLQYTYPKLKVIVSSKRKVSEDFIEEVKTGESDFAIIIGPVSRKNIIWRRICHEQMFVLAPLTYAGRDYIELIEEGPFIHSTRYCDNKGSIDKCLTDSKIVPDIKYVVDSFSMVPDMVGLGLGVGICPEIFLKPTDHSRFKILPFGSPVVSREVGLIYSSDSNLKKIIDLVYEELLICTN